VATRKQERRLIQPAPLRRGVVLLTAIVVVLAALALVVGRPSTKPLTPAGIAVEYSLQVLALYVSIAATARKWAFKISLFYWEIPASILSFIISIALIAFIIPHYFAIQSSLWIAYGVSYTTGFSATRSNSIY
jgi:hypothetical protein